MKTLCVILGIAACFVHCGMQARASGQPAPPTALYIDVDKPSVGYKMDCDGVYKGTATDRPDASVIRSNLGVIMLDNSSSNYELTHDAITIGQTVSAGFQLHPIDFSKPANATVHCKDVAGNDSIFTVVYTPHLLTMSAQSADSLYPQRELIMRVPLINLSGDTIRVTRIFLDSTDVEFRLDASTPSNVLMKKLDTLWVTVHVLSDNSGRFSNHLHVNLGCDKSNVQSIALSATYGRLDIIVKDVDFGKKKVNTQWISDVMAINNGPLSATLTSLSLKIGTQSFALRNLVSLPITVAAGASVKLADVEFAPKSKGTWSDNFSFDVLEDAVGVISTPVVKAESDDDVEVRETSDDVVRISPCPAADVLQVFYARGGGMPVQATIYDVSGNSLHTLKSLDGAPMQFDLSSYESGLYLCRVECGSEQWMSRVYIVR